MNLSDIRKEYTLAQLDVHNVLQNPIEQFEKWLSEALEAQVNEPTAMYLSTVSAEGRPSGRIVLLKNVDTGFTFFTNYLSKKGKEIAQNEYAALTFFWAELERQIRIEGRVEKVSEEESEVYFASRPFGSRIGAIISPQSEVIANREVLEVKQQKALQEYSEMNCPRPLHWGGYRLLPDYVEFWQGRASRLHDRICYIQEEQAWNITRLAP